MDKESEFFTLISKNVYIDKLHDIFNKYNNTYHSTVKMEFVDVKTNTYIDFNKGNSKEYPKFEAGDHVRISRFKNIFAEGCIPNWSEEVFLIKKVKNIVLSMYVICDLNGEEIIETIYEKISLEEKVKVELYLSNYARKADLKT